jgi:AcrR family transcriptional regulator
VSRTRSEPPPRRERYHHGDLREALIGVALQLIAERGVHGFSLAEASRRLGVSSAAPYRHFADRDELLAAIAARALDAFRVMYLEATSPTDSARQRLSALAAAYVRFAAERPAMFETVLRAGIDKRRHRELLRADERVQDLFYELVGEVCGDEGAGARALAAAVEATAHGFAMLLLEGGDGDGAGPNASDDAARRAGAATLALIDGRAALA